MIEIIRSLEGFPWETVREALSSLPRSRVSKRRLREGIMFEEGFCVRAPLDDLLQMLQWWYAAIYTAYSEMTRHSQILSFAEDIFQNNPRLEVRTYYDDTIYELRLVIEHEGQSSLVFLGEAAFVRRTDVLFDACLSTVGSLRKCVDFLAGNFSTEDVTVLEEGKYEEIRIGRNVIIVEEDE